MGELRIQPAGRVNDTLAQRTVGPLADAAVVGGDTVFALDGAVVEVAAGAVVAVVGIGFAGAALIEMGTVRGAVARSPELPHPAASTAAAAAQAAGATNLRAFMSSL